MPSTPSPPANDSDFNRLGWRVSTLPPGMPTDWYRAPIRIGVGLILTESNCVDGSFFESFARESVFDVIDTVRKNRDVFLGYSFYLSGAVPAFKYDVEWPLLRRGDSEPYPRARVQLAEPWVWNWDQTLFEITNRPTGAWTSITHLRVGGRTPEHAIANWTKCAKALRSHYRGGLEQRTRNGKLVRVAPDAKKDRPEAESGLDRHGDLRQALIDSKPMRESFEDEDTFEEAFGYWMGHQGRILALTGGAKREAHKE